MIKSRYQINTKYSEELIRGINITIDNWIDSLGEKKEDVIISKRNGLISFQDVNSSFNESTLREIVLKTKLDDNRTLINSNYLIADKSNIIINVDFEVKQERLLFSSNLKRIHINPPRFYFEALSLCDDWNTGNYKINCCKTLIENEYEVKFLIEKILNENRKTPIILIQNVSQNYETMKEFLHKNVASQAEIFIIEKIEIQKLFSDLIYQDLDCYNDAVRIYFPITDKNNIHAFDHPLWTKNKISELNENTVCNKIKRLIQFKSSIGVPFPIEVTNFKNNLNRHREHEYETTKLRLLDIKDYEQLYKYAEEENCILRNREAELSSILQRVLGNLEEEVEKNNFYNEILNNPESESNALKEAIKYTKISELRNALEMNHSVWFPHLGFGKDAIEAMLYLHEKSTPPYKIIRHLDTLNQLSLMKKKGELKDNVLKVLADRGVPASGENNNSAKNPTFRSLRTWDCDGKRTFYELHTKPNDATNNCVRIYFIWSNNRFVIGYIGNHPEVD